MTKVGQTNLPTQSLENEEASALSHRKAFPPARNPTPPFFYSETSPIIALKDCKVIKSEGERFAMSCSNYRKAHSSNEPGSEVQAIAPPPMRDFRMLDLRRVPEKRNFKEWSKQNNLWQKRAEFAEELAEAVVCTRGFTETYTYKIGSETVAMVNLTDFSPNGRRRVNCLQIEILVSHPGVSGAGQPMIEHAASLSESRGFNGRLVLIPDRTAVAFYKSVGFEFDKVYMSLDPSKRNDLWHKKNSQWELNTNKGKKFLISKLG